jgi:hypothetical protein
MADILHAQGDTFLEQHPWHGGRHTELRVARPWSGPTRRCTDAEAIALVRRMAGQWNDDAIAIQLNLLGWRTGTGNHWTRMRVRELRSRLDLVDHANAAVSATRVKSAPWPVFTFVFTAKAPY